MYAAVASPIYEKYILVLVLQITIFNFALGDCKFKSQTEE